MIKSPYTKIEKKVMDALIKAINCFRKLKHTHPSHEQDFVDGIHKCQHVIMHKTLQRDYPKEFPTYKKEKK